LRLLKRAGDLAALEAGRESLEQPLPSEQAIKVARGIQPPYTPSNSLARLRELGIAWQPQPRTWALADPLLAAWTRDHAPPWAQRRGG
jgi:hypothetical protein